MNDELTYTNWFGRFIPEPNVEFPYDWLYYSNLDYAHDNQAWINCDSYGLPGDFNEDAGY